MHDSAGRVPTKRGELRDDLEKICESNRGIVNQSKDAVCLIFRPSVDKGKGPFRK